MKAEAKAFSVKMNKLYRVVLMFRCPYKYSDGTAAAGQMIHMSVCVSAEILGIAAIR